MSQATTKPAPIGRAYSTKFEDHKGLMIKIARNCYARARSSKISSLEFDDVLGEMHYAYVKASQGYDPERGITFGAYLGRACYNQFNKVMERLELEQYGHKLPYLKRETRKPVEEMTPKERSAFYLECEQAGNKPAAKAGLHHPTRGLALISASDFTREGGSDFDIFAFLTDEDDCEDGLTSPERASETRRMLKELRSDDTLLPETRNYIRHLMGFTVSEQGLAAIKERSNAVRTQLRERYGIALNCVRV